MHNSMPFALSPDRLHLESGVAQKVGAAGGAEVKENNIAVWLTPAVNIHRSPSVRT